MPSDIAQLEQWVGRSESVVDVIDPVRVRQLAATLNDTMRLESPAAAALPAGWHWGWFNPLAPQSGLGDDGHPRRGDFLPPVRLPRRMWAGSRLNWSRVFTVGSTVTRDSRILTVQAKSGRGGDMVFVTVGHRYHDRDGPLLDEEHDIVYREAASEREKSALSDLAARVRAGEHGFERAGARQQAIHADSVMLFRYSAATFNGHRIHYDIDYCRDVEAYPGLVVHGPLIATLLLGFVEHTVAPGRFVRSFAFRARRPTFDIGPLHLHAAGECVNSAMDVWSTDNVGEVGIDARVELD
ncbi:MaoC family dehydratase N-terminal domain-containing protein [Comamonadaceae bacterium G21597-S1]|nr:MaoC family dehydratase N-terminal domain-containing protein [Comamonadaceae bacterium G21597-S1]